MCEMPTASIASSTTCRSCRSSFPKNPVCGCRPRATSSYTVNPPVCVLSVSTTPIWREISRSDMADNSFPFNRIFPDNEGWDADKVRSRVDLPEPFAPNRQVSSPLRREMCIRDSDTGASLGVALVMLFWGGTLGVSEATTLTGFTAIIAGAFLGSVTVLGTILFFSTIVKNNIMLLIVGIMVGYITSSVISLLNYFATAEGDVYKRQQYDNMNGYLRTNGFDRIFAQEDYPKDKVVNSFGVQDDFLYQYALPILTETADEGQPFFAVLLSISNHPPYVIPKDFKTHSSTDEHRIVEFRCV